MLWQSAYAEYFFTQTMWPDFSRIEFAEAIIAFAKRERRFGKTSAQICPEGKNAHKLRSNLLVNPIETLC